MESGINEPRLDPCDVTKKHDSLTLQLQLDGCVLNTVHLLIKATCKIKLVKLYINYRQIVTVNNESIVIIILTHY